MKVLLAEDDPVSLRLTEAVMADWGYEVVTVSDGKQAWDVLTGEDAPRLAVLDWLMPELDGVEVCRRLRHEGKPPYTYIILLTSKTSKDDVFHALMGGADDYISKPFHSGELRARLLSGQRILSLQDQLLGAMDDLRHQATHDPLTGLPNRLLFGDRLSQGIADARRRGTGLCVMYVDLDRFKHVNDTFGHGTGDELLKKAADRLKMCLRGSDTLARVGGDEFTVILPDTRTAADAARVARDILSAMDDSFHVGPNEFTISASIGISVWPMDGNDAETLVKNADAAMFAAKDAGRGAHREYDSIVGAAVRDRLMLETELRHAFEQDQLLLYYQPQIDIRTGKMIGMEALIRWPHASGEWIDPKKLIALAEDIGLIAPITQWVLDTACAQAAKFHETGLSDVSISVNVSPRHLSQAGLVECVSSALKKSGLPPDSLHLEITETALVPDPDSAADVLTRLKELGVHVAIDDFGTGYSSLSYLKDLPVDVVKIDQSFIAGLTSCNENAAIAATVVKLSHILNKRVIAEGVETLDQLEALRAMGCDMMQGFFVSPAIPGEEIRSVANIGLEPPDQIGRAA